MSGQILDLATVRTDALAPIWWIAGHGRVWLNHRLQCPCCESIEISFAHKRGVIIENTDGNEYELPMPAGDITQHKGDGIPGCWIPLICHNGHNFILNIQCTKEEGLTVSAMPEENAYEDLYPDTFTKWGGRI